MGRLFRTLIILAMAGILYGSTRLPQEVLAATVYDTVSDDTAATANTVYMGDSISGSITEVDDLDYYKFQLESAGCINLKMTSYMQYYCIILYNIAGEEIWYTDDNEWTESVGYRRDEYKIYLEQGTYYMLVNGYKWGDAAKSMGTYECQTSFVSSEVNNVESDNSFSTANAVTLGNKITGQISENDDFDTYKFTLSEAGCVTLNMTSYMQYYCIIVYNSNGEEIWYTDDNEWTESVGYRNDVNNLYLENGTYYMQVNGYKWGDACKTTGKYVVDTQFVTSKVSFDGDNDSFATAKSVSWGKIYNDQISINDDIDTYKFSIESDKTIVIDITSHMQYYCILLYNIAGEEIWYTDDNEWDDNVGYRKDTYNIVLSKGTYYMQVNGYKWGDTGKSTGKYTFILAGLNQSNCNHDYEDTEVSPSYTAKGYTYHKCSKCGKSYKDDYISKKILGQAYISSYGLIPAKKKITVNFTGVYDATGYQIRYSTNKKFASNVKIVKTAATARTKVLKGLARKKKYYVQVRGFRKENGKTVYGKWSMKRYAKTR